MESIPTILTVLRRVIAGRVPDAELVICLELAAQLVKHTCYGSCSAAAN